MKPQIAFSCCHNPTVHQDGWEVLGPHFYVYSDYIRPIVELGGAPLIIPVLRDEDYYRDSMRNAQGLVLVGGGDINPFLFSRNVEKNIGKVNPDMDYGEMEMAKIALEMNIPILAICRGIQLLMCLGKRRFYKRFENFPVILVPAPDYLRMPLDSKHPFLLRHFDCLNNAVISASADNRSLSHFRHSLMMI